MLCGASSGRERLGVLRVSTAYEFYQALQQYLVLKEQAYMDREKPTFEASNYLLFYVAAGDEDAVDKECIFALNRMNKWDCTGVTNTNLCYEFMGLQESCIALRHLPCPCQHCATFDYGCCDNKEVVGEMTMQEVYYKEVDCPDVLVEPLTSYANAVLLAFMQANGVKIPTHKIKTEYIAALRGKVPHLILNNADDNNVID